MSKTISVMPDDNNPKYLKSFLSMMESERHSTIEDKKRFEIKPLKFKILNFAELDSSEFNLLDPFQRHMRAVEVQLFVILDTVKKDSSLAFQIKPISKTSQRRAAKPKIKDHL
jgi:hypothetical protein